ncbi:MAG TPA: UdgX family uracil-DNA binding protein [Solirubrobacterales bacterium]|jgi:DNA polymerase|nr:UdgX family uracil-DNA binding protein [Solirubrobacterales bacterium]
MATETDTAAEFVPDSRSLRALRRAAAGCRGCPLWQDATQTVFGAGPRKAKLMLVGEQPGDREDVEGEPFVGPAGRILAQALQGAEIERGEVYLTNAVKHFKWRPRGKRRLHQTPRAGEVEACKPWLEAELDAVRPVALLALGATAAKALYGPSVRVTRDRGKLLDSPLAPVAALTVHPSAILRLRDHDEREEAIGDLVADLRQVAREMARQR